MGSECFFLCIHILDSDPSHHSFDYPHVSECFFLYIHIPESDPLSCILSEIHINVLMVTIVHRELIGIKHQEIKVASLNRVPFTVTVFSPSPEASIMSAGATIVSSAGFSHYSRTTVEG